MKHAIFCLCLFLTACATPKVVTQTETVTPQINEALRQPCTPPILVDELVVRDLYANRDAWREAYELCAADHDALIEALSDL